MRIGRLEYGKEPDSLAQGFYEWHHEYHKADLAKLLSGEEVVLKSDVLNGMSLQDGVKFNMIELEFRAMDPEVDLKLKKDLENFEIRMIHSGSSHYRF